MNENNRKEETITCAVVEHNNGQITHHTNVISGGISQTRKTVCVKLKFTDHSEKTIDSGVAIKLGNDSWIYPNKPLY